jgi:ATP-dependent helicase/nuclease subunit B
MSLSRRLESAPHGLLLALLARLALDEAEPVALAALLGHPLAAFGMTDADRRTARRLIERTHLRGPRRHADLADLHSKAPEPCRALIAAVREALAPLRARDGGSLTEFAGAVADAAESAADPGPRVRNSRLWSGADGAAAARFLQELIEHGSELGSLSAWEASRAFAHALGEQEMSPERTGDPRVAILGLLEGRLMRRDLVVLGAMNEGVWPAPPPEDMFLSRPMREALGLAPTEARIGLAAHDFAQLASAPRVAVTRTLRREGAPTIASRWLWRLETLLRAADGERLIDPPVEQNAALWAHALDQPRQSVRIGPAKPMPPATARLARISVTEAETLIRDPYAVYARRVLGLRSLDPIGGLAGASHRGRAIHKAVEQFDAGDAQVLLNRVDLELARGGFSAAHRTFDRARLAKACAAFAAWVAERRNGGAVVHREIEGSLALPGGELLIARADRIELIGGRAEVVDYKTGAAPTDKEVAAGLAPQLLLEAAMLARGAFKDAPRASVADLVYWRFGGSEPGARIVKLEEGAAAAAEAALASLIELLARYAQEGQPFLSKPRAQFARPYADYDLLARRNEWVDAGDAP